LEYHWLDSQQRSLLNLLYNPDTGYIGGYDKLYRTSDGGISWDIVYGKDFSQDRYFMLVNIKFFSKTTGYAFAISYPYHFLLKTTNSGLSWDTTNINVSIIDGSMFCIDEQHIFLTSKYGQIYRSVDSGCNWETVKPYKPEYMTTLNSIFFPSPSTGYAITGWTPDNSGIDIWLAKLSYTFDIHKSIDSGKTWQTFKKIGIPLNSVYFINDTVGFVAGGWELIMKTTTGGGTEIKGNYPWWFFTGIQENKQQVFDDVRVYPTLFNDQINLEIKNPLKERASLRVINSLGQLVLSTSVQPGETFKSLSTIDVAKGFYLLVLQNGNGSKSYKVIKE
jgi:hypothetical protein